MRGVRFEQVSEGQVRPFDPTQPQGPLAAGALLEGRSPPLAYFTDGDDVILIASNGGAPHHPAWYHNLVANPEVELWAKGAASRWSSARPWRGSRGLAFPLHPEGWQSLVYCGSLESC
jgi:F420H(2)-dependent quinone reductase